MEYDSYLRLRQIVGDPKRKIPPLVPVGASTLWAWVKSGKFPAPIKLGPKTTVWKMSAVQRFIDDGGQAAR